MPKEGYQKPVLISTPSTILQDLPPIDLMDASGGSEIDLGHEEEGRHSIALGNR
jgi:hypothetical protein